MVLHRTSPKNHMCLRELTKHSLDSGRLGAVTTFLHKEQNNALFSSLVKFSTVVFTKKTLFINNLMAFLVKMDEFGHKGRAIHVTYLNFSSLHCPPKQTHIQACTLHGCLGNYTDWKLVRGTTGTSSGWLGLQHPSSEDRLRFLGLFGLKSWVWRKNQLWECYKKHSQALHSTVGGINGNRKRHTWTQGKPLLPWGSQAQTEAAQENAASTRRHF